MPRFAREEREVKVVVLQEKAMDREEATSENTSLETGIDLQSQNKVEIAVRLGANTSMQRRSSHKRLYRDVWYRRYLKHFAASGNRSVPFHESFKRHVLQPAGIPVTKDLVKFHELFRPSHRQYSPLIGMIFTYNNFINNLYRYGDAEEPAVHLIQSLFHSLPGGEIQTTHLFKFAGAHLSAAVVGNIFEAFERIKGKPATTEANGKGPLADELLNVIVNHPDYQGSRLESCKQVQLAKEELEALHRRDAESQPVREKIKMLEGDIIKLARHKIKRAEKELQKAKDSAHRERLLSEIAVLHNSMEEAEEEVKKLRVHIVTSLDFKLARKALRRAQDMFDLEENSRMQLVESLARCFWEYELRTEQSATLPRYTTTAILLAYLWRKYDSIHYLRGFMESMAHLSALTCTSATLTTVLDQPSSTRPEFRLPGHRQEFSAHDKATAACIVIGKPGISRRPPIVQFSYVRWADYSEFPDCGETALRNFFNQLLFNPATGLFDHELLLELWERFYPHLNQKLIDFYTQHHIPQEASDHAICRAWIDVVSNLNHGRENDLKIRYRREQQQQNIASPLSNVLRVFNALLGIEPINDVQVQEVVRHINELRDWHIAVDPSGLRKDGFGIVGLSSGNVRYELQSYKPVHFGFKQLETLELDAAGRHDFEVFQRLMRYACGPPCLKQEDDPDHFEQVALASLFVPYFFGRGKGFGRFLERCPLHYRVLFGDLDHASQREKVVQWSRRHVPDPRLTKLVTGIKSHVGTFGVPPPPSSELVGVQIHP
jgi:hypothetical protein